MERELRERAARLGMTASADFLGHRDDVAALMAGADVYVRPSLTDGLSLSLLEAMAAGLPIVASAAPGASEVLEDGRSGVLVRPGSVAALAAGIRELLDDERRARALGALARTRALAFSWDRAALATADEFRRVCA